MPDKYDEFGGAVLRPRYFAHIVLRTANYKPMSEFYKTFLGGHATYENEKLSFITYDEEHHRVAILNLPDTGPKLPSSAGLGTLSPSPVSRAFFHFLFQFTAPFDQIGVEMMMLKVKVI